MADSPESVDVTDQNLKLIALLGNFVIAWSIFDQAIDVGIMKHLGITSRQAAIVLSGLGFERKVSILRALINENSPPNKDAISSISKIMETAKRNLLLHASIWMGNDHLEFVKMDTHKTLTVRHENYNVKRFSETIDAITANILQLQSQLQISDEELSSIAKIGKSLADKSATSPSPPSTKKG